jgi:23S rRNA G2445 N2-methylase RlmL
MKIPETSRIIITCNKRLSPFLGMEVAALGFRPERIFSTGIELQGTLKDCIRLNMHLRCASQVLFSLKRFKANSPEDVYETILQFPWEELLSPDGYFSVTSTVDHFTVNNNLFVNVKVKDAIVDRFRRQIGKRPDSGPEQDRAVVHLFWKEEDAEVFIDTSGETLAKHGYRKIPGKAPMLEALAASAILATNWDRKSPFVNPMCGSSTLAIEAALLATNRFPGLLRRNYGFMHVKNFDRDYYEKELDSLEKEITTLSDVPIIASDRSEDAIQISKVNAQAAGVEKFIHFQRAGFEETEIPIQPGVIFFNPEYGERLGEISELEKTYALIGDFMKTKCQGYAGYIFTGNLDLAKKIGLKASRRIEFYSGQLDCRLLSYELYGGTRRNPPAPGPTEALKS